MHSLSDLQSFFKNNEITVGKFYGYSLVVGKDVWTLAHGVFYRNSEPANPKDPEIIKKYKKAKKK